MDDLNLFAKNATKLEEFRNIVKEFSSVIGMEFRPDKCAKVTFKMEKFI